MLKVLLKKQFTEVFKSYFFDAKKNRMRSNGAVIVFFILFFVLMFVFLGGVFTILSVSLCAPLTSAGMGWLYFTILCGVSVVLGAFGSVFNTYSGLYLSKDNDLLLSMPIPVNVIIAARLLNVYIMGSLYSLTALLPAIIVYWATVGFTVSRLVSGILLILIVTFTVLILSCILGWTVAKISLKLKNKSYITAILAVVFIVIYYFVYFKATDLVKDIIVNASIYGERIKGGAYLIYLFGRIGEGDFIATAVFTAATAILFALVWLLLSRSFIKIATGGGSVRKVGYKDKTARQRTAFKALLSKEFRRFTSSANYMLNCGLGVLVLMAAGVAILIKGRDLSVALSGVFPGQTDIVAVFLCGLICLIVCMNDMAAPSVSLEGKSIWIPKSLPVDPKLCLRAKASLQLLLTAIPALFASVCSAIVLPLPTVTKLFVAVMPVSFSVFNALFCTFLGTKMPMMNWTNELYPIKQSGAVAVALLGGWGIAAAATSLYLLVGSVTGAAIYLGILTALFAAAAFMLLRWLDTKGSKRFSEI